MSATLGNSDTALYGWASKTTELAEGVKDYNGQEARFLPWQFPNALTWAHGKNWQGYTDFDTDHGNHLPFAVVQGFEMGQTFSANHIVGLSELLTKVLWDGSTGSPQVRNFMDGSNGPFLRFNNGRTFPGWYLRRLRYECLELHKIHGAGSQERTVNPTLTIRTRLTAERPCLAISPGTWR